MRLKDLENLDASELLKYFSLSNDKSSIAEEFTALSMPSKKTEEYKYADIETYLEMEIDPICEVIEDIEESDRLIITDGIVTHAPSCVTVKYASKLAVDSSHFDPMYYLGHIMTRDVLHLEVKESMDLNIVHKLTKANSLAAYRVFITVAPNVDLRLYEGFEADGVNNSLILNGFDVLLERDSTLNMVKNQTINNKAYKMLSSHSIDVRDNARVDLATFDYGDTSSLQTLQIRLGTRSHAEVAHLLYIKGKAKRGTVSKILHIGEHSTSNQVAKNILDGKSRGIFDALIKVENSANHTKAHQSSKSILLANGAYMASKPQLEIYIHELEASHGSSIGQLNEKELFYLQSRGVNETEAKKMLVQAFANEIIKCVKNEKIQMEIHADFERSFYGDTQLACLETCHVCEDLILQ